MNDNIEEIKIKKLEVNSEKIVIKDVTLEDLELCFFGRILKIKKVEIDEVELDKILI